MIIIDTASIHHSLRSIGKKLDYINFILFLKEKHPSEIVIVLADKNAEIFVKYLKKIPDIIIIEKEAYKKKITKTHKVWYLSFAVDIALITHSYYATREKIIIVSTDSEILPILNTFQVELYGIGTPKILREHSLYNDVPEQYLIDSTQLVKKETDVK